MVQALRREAVAEITITIRFWIIAGISVAFGMGTFYAEWVARA